MKSVKTHLQTTIFLLAGLALFACSKSTAPNPSAGAAAAPVLGTSSAALGADGRWEAVSGPTVAGWRMVGVIHDPAAGGLPHPGTLVSPDGSAQFQSDFFEYTNGRYQKATQLSGGKGYWVKTTPGTYRQVGGVLPRGPVALSLAVGWNLLGNPLDGALDWAGRVSQNAVCGAKVFVFGNGVYVQTTTVSRHQAFWTKCSAGGSAIFTGGAATVHTSIPVRPEIPPYQATPDNTPPPPPGHVAPWDVNPPGAPTAP